VTGADPLRRGYLFLIDKPEGLTSHDVVERVRSATGVSRIGHSGTLDPMATGLLLLCAGGAARLQGFFTLMTIWEQANALVRSGEELTPEAFVDWFAATSDVHSIFSVPFGCADAPPPYVSVCAKKIAITQWNGEVFQNVEDIWDGTDLIAGTELKPGP